MSGTKLKRGTSSMDREMLARIDERQKAHDAKLDLILSEVKKTNGRVTDLEIRRIPALENWKSSLRGSWAALCVVCIVVSTLVGWALTIIIK